MADDTTFAFGEIWNLLDSRGMGGIESHVGELAAGLRDAGQHPRVLFLADHGPHPLRDRLDREGLPWEALAGSFGALYARLKAGRPGVLHTHGYKANLFGRIAARLLGIPVVASYHAGEAAPGMLAWYDRADRWTSWLGGRIAVSKPILARLPFGGTLVPNFIAVPAVATGGTADSVAFVGRFSHEKGPDLFCELAAMVPDTPFIAFGDGPMLADLRAKYGQRVDFRGARAGMDGAWHEIGLLAVTSRAEGLPLAVLEAMANGVPVAAFAVGALPDVIRHGDNGYLAAPGNLEELAGAIRHWQHADRKALIHNTKSTIESGYSRPAGIATILARYTAAGWTGAMRT